MKKFIFFITLLLFIFTYDSIFFKDTTYDLYNKYVKKNFVKIINNENYLNNIKNKKEDLYIYKEYNDDNVKNKNELINKMFTIINNGYDNYTFYCKYDNCINDINNLENDVKLKHINDFINPYNKYKNIKTASYNNGKIDIKINKLYTEEDIKTLDEFINNIIDEYSINNYNDINIKIKIFHDYLINHSSYDEDYVNNHDNGNESNKANGPLLHHKGVCSGYSDAMSLFLDKININNIKISNDVHVWNAVNINNIWYNIDSTFDDPVTNTHEDYLLHEYFMISKDEITSKGDKEHIIDDDIYSFIY